MNIINKIFFLFISIFQLFKINNSSELSEIGEHLLLKLRTKRKDEVKGLSEEDYMKENMYNEFYSKFNIGIPPQRLTFYYELNFNESSISEEFYAKDRSSTYKLIDENNTKGYISQESFEVDQDIVLQNFTFLLN